MSIDAETMAFCLDVIVDTEQMKSQKCALEIPYWFVTQEEADQFVRNIESTHNVTCSDITHDLCKKRREHGRPIFDNADHAMKDFNKLLKLNKGYYTVREDYPHFDDMTVHDTDNLGFYDMYVLQKEIAMLRAEIQNMKALNR